MDLTSERDHPTTMEGGRLQRWVEHVRTNREQVGASWKKLHAPHGDVGRQKICERVAERESATFSDLC